MIINIVSILCCLATLCYGTPIESKSAVIISSEKIKDAIKPVDKPVDIVKGVDETVVPVVPRFIDPVPSQDAILIDGFRKIKPAERQKLRDDLFEGDIIGVKKGVSKAFGQFRNGYNTWQNGIVYYQILNHYGQGDLNTIYAGMRMIERQTAVNGRACISFVQRTFQRDYIRIGSGDGCYSMVGNLRQGAQEVSLNTPGCMVPGIVAHEMMHALGFWHEQSRPDRDNYVQIMWNNIQSDNWSQYDKYSSGVETNGVPYDYGSVMHYDGYSFTNNGYATIVAKDSRYNNIMGQRQRLSSTDVESLRRYYGCK